MDFNAWHLGLNAVIAAVSAVASAYVLVRRQHSADIQAAASRRQELSDGLYREITRLQETNDKFRAENIEQQTRILELSRTIIDLQTKINLLEIKLSQLTKE